MRPVAPERPPHRHPSGRDRIRCGIAPEAEPVEDHQDDGARAPFGRSDRARALRHAAVRAAAVSPARATIPAISSGLSDAPPTSAPSIEGSARNSAMFDDVTLPPYRTGTSSAAAFQPRPARTSRMVADIAAASRPLAFRPVPIAQTGA